MYDRAMQAFDAKTARVGIRRPAESDCNAFIAMAQASAPSHYPWVDPPKTAPDFQAYLRSRRLASDDGFLVCDLASGRIAGVINLNCIVRGHFHSAYLGYYAAIDFARQGYMTEGLKLVIGYAFGEMGLHRLESNIQPANSASIALVRRCGFHKEGFSPNYLRIFGAWRDHERWAILNETNSPAEL